MQCFVNEAQSAVYGASHKVQDTYMRQYVVCLGDVWHPWVRADWDICSYLLSDQMWAFILFVLVIALLLVTLCFVGKFLALKK